MNIDIERYHKGKKCPRTPFLTAFRILMALTILVLGIWKQSWIAILAIVPLLSAFTGNCGLGLRFGGTDDDPS